MSTNNRLCPITAGPNIDINPGSAAQPSTNHKFINLLTKYFRKDKELRQELGISYLMGCRYSYLAAISNKNLSDNILKLIDEFLSDLSFEEASKYVNEEDWYLNSLILECKNIKLMRIIIKYVRDINVSNACGGNALMCACVSPIIDLEIVKLLLNHKINVNAKSDDEMTALMYVCNQITGDNYEMIEQVIELLIHCGADVFIKSRTDKIAFDYIKDKSLLSSRLSQWLQGTIRLNNTKRAM